MTSKLSSSPTPKTFADAWQREVVEKAAETVAGPDGVIDGADAASADARLTGAEKLASPTLRNLEALTGAASADVADFVAAEHARALEAAARVTGADGRLSSADARALPGDLRVAFHFLRTGELPAETTSAPRFSEAVVAAVLAQYGLDDRDALLSAAALFDADGNRYLKRAELEAAAKMLSGAADELGIVSDIDKTLMPPETSGRPPPPPYPGVATLLRLLDVGLTGAGRAGDAHYVTARSPDRTAGVPAWLDEHGLPQGTVDTGTSAVPWIAQPEKVRDIAAHFDASPTQRFVLFGDNSHRDPEVYREIMGRYPDRVVAVFIHNVKAFTDASRFDGMHLVGSYAEAAALLFAKRVLDEAGARAVMAAAQLEGLDITDAQIQALIDAHRPA